MTEKKAAMGVSMHREPADREAAAGLGSWQTKKEKHAFRPDACNTTKTGVWNQTTA
ncbi:MAG: hypothetical protein GY703_25070 [Gammaproteobacteria bacterium]|nr:hypothetical protein [Gammaproteobacteria bacterium]